MQGYLSKVMFSFKKNEQKLSMPLSDIYQYTKIKNPTPTLAMIICGVPQGS